MKVTLTDKPVHTEMFSDLLIGQAFKWAGLKSEILLIKVSSEKVLVFGHTYDRPTVVNVSALYSKVIKYTVEEIIADQT